MAVKTKKYKHGKEEVRVVKVSVKNLVSVANWVKDGTAVYNVAAGGEETNHRVRVHTPKGFRVAKVGDYVLKTEGGDFLVVKAPDFESGGYIAA